MRIFWAKNLAAVSSIFLVGTFATLTPGHAAVYDITFTGVVSSLVDTTGAYGTAGTDLGGMPFTNTFIIDTANATYNGGPYGSGQYTEFSANLPAGLNAASSTINGHTVNFGLNVFDYREQLVSPNPYNFSLQEDQAEGFSWFSDANGWKYTVTVLRDEPLSYTLSIPLSLSSPYTLAIDNANGPVYGYGSFQIFNVSYDYATQTVTQTSNVGYFDEKSVTVSLDSSSGTHTLNTPLPATWVLMLSGAAAFGLIALRRNRLSFSAA